jgi:histidine triad (HIT) family protein
MNLENAEVEEAKPCKFCEIVRGEREAHFVLETGHSVAFLDSRPLFPGHCLLVPRDHKETLVDLPDSLLAPLFSQVRTLARAVEEAMEAEGTFIAINNRVSQSVPHLHVHVVPRRRKDGLRGFFWPRHSYRSTAEMAEVQRAIRAALARIDPRRIGLPSPDG